MFKLFIFGLLLAIGPVHATDFSDSRTVTCLPLEQGLDRGCAYLPQSKSECADPLDPFFLESCLYENRSELVPEIVDVPNPEWSKIEKALSEKSLDGKKIFSSLPRVFKLPPGSIFSVVGREVFQKYSADRILRSLIYRIYANHELPKLKKILNGASAAERENLRSLYDAVTIQLAFKPKISESVANRGFLNMHQIGTSNGYRLPTTRFVTEETYLGLNLAQAEWQGDEVDSYLPKYAYASSALEEDEGLGKTSKFDPTYGDVIAVMKSGVLHHSTFTPADSLMAMVENLSKNEIFTARMLYSKNQYLSNADSVYAEAQVYGALTKADVDFLVVDCFVKPAGAQDPNQLSIAALDAQTISSMGHQFGVPIYNCKVEKLDQGKSVPVFSLAEQDFMADRVRYRVLPNQLLFGPETDSK
jgi:hypothetical protein